MKLLHPWKHRVPFSSPMLIGLIVVSLSALAQLPSATLNGIVTDPQGALVAGARVVATNMATAVSRESTTSADGRYVFSNLLPGDYTVRVENRGFATREFKDVHLQVGHSVTLDVPLQLASEAQTVTVSGGVVGVELTQSEVQGQVTERTVETIPLNGRNFLELAFLIPGNRPATNFDPTKTNTLEVSSAGQFGRGGNITVDGGDNNDQVVGGTLMNFPQDAVHEFQIATNRYTAEVGHSASSIINIATKNGTNDFHGSMFVFVRNRKLQARAATLDPSQPKPPFDRQQFGGSLGGALKKDRAWWFLSGEYRNQHAAVQTGFRDFVNKLVVTSSAPAPLSDLLLFGRLDFKATEKDNVYLRYGYNISDETANGSLRVALGTAANRQSSLNRFNSWLGQWTRTISGNKVNTVTFDANAFVNEIPRFKNDAATLVTSGNYGAGPIDTSFHNEFRLATLQDGGNFRIPQRTRLNSYEVKENFAWTHSAHTFHFGAEVQRQIPYALFDLFGSKTIFLTQPFATADKNGDGVVNDLDIPVAIAIASGAPIRPPVVNDFANTYFGFHVQDDWRVLPNLTINAGLRYELDTDVFGVGPQHHPCPAPLNVKPADPCVWLASVLPIKHSRDPHDFAPRVGFAWDPFKKGQTVVRGGYGVYYDRIVLEVRLLELLLDGRNISLRTFDPGNAFVNFAEIFNRAPGASGIGINKIDNNARHPLVQQFTLGLQQQLGKNWIVSADGVHNYGTRFLIGRPLRDASNNRITVTDPLTGESNSITNIESSAKTWYDGLLLSVQKRPTHIADKWSYAFNVNYTLSKSLNYANDDQIPFNEGGQADVVLGINNIRLEKGYSPTDERHRLVFFGSLEAPFGITIAPIVTISSSVPMDTLLPSVGGRLPIIGRNSIGRAIKTGDDLNKKIREWNLTHDDIPEVNPALKFGDSFVSADLRVTKSISITERQKLSLIGEVFNLSNTTNIRGSNNNNYSGRLNDITAPDFYRPLSTAGGFFGAGGPRTFQLAVRYAF